MTANEDSSDARMTRVERVLESLAARHENLSARLESLAARHESLAHSVELLATMHQKNEQLLAGALEAIARLALIAESHERRLGEGGL